MASKERGNKTQMRSITLNRPESGVMCVAQEAPNSTHDCSAKSKIRSDRVRGARLPAPRAAKLKSPSAMDLCACGEAKCRPSASRNAAATRRMACPPMPKLCTILHATCSTRPRSTSMCSGSSSKIALETAISNHLRTCSRPTPWSNVCQKVPETSGGHNLCSWQCKSLCSMHHTHSEFKLPPSDVMQGMLQGTCILTRPGTARPGLRHPNKTARSSTGR